MDREFIEKYADEYIKTFWYEQPESIQRKILMGFMAGYIAACKSNSIPEGKKPTPNIHNEDLKYFNEK